MSAPAFLHASDIAGKGPGSNGNGDFCVPDIRELVREGKEVLVQVVKDPLGTKGARLTTYITLPSRFLVLLPMGEGVGISARIEDEVERERLKSEILDIQEADGDTGGVIVRTAAEGVSRDALRADLAFLRKLWSAIQLQSRNAGVQTLVHADLPLPIRVLRDMVTSDVERILVDSEKDLSAPCENSPRASCRVSRPCWSFTVGGGRFSTLHGTEDEIKKALGRSISLKSGGYVIIDQTEAMTTIDVNTGAYVGHRNLEETIYRTNLEAAVTIARQLRLRNLGGIIIIDFIDMEEPEHRDRVLQVLDQSMARDHAKAPDHAGLPAGIGGNDAQTDSRKLAARAV